MKRAFVVMMLAGAGLGAALETQAADKDDIYASVLAGDRFQKKARPRIQGSVAAGYCPVDDIGIGLGFEQSAAFSSSDPDKYGTQLYAEARWFLEPFEVAGGAGWRRLVARAGGSRGDPMFIASSAYLLALTASLSTKFEIQAQYALGNDAGQRWSVFAGAGFRLLY